MEEADTPPADEYEPLFALYEYALAEQRFVGEAVEALARARDGFFAQITREPVSRVQTARLTTDTGETVELEPIPVPFHISPDAGEVIAGRLDAFLTSLDTAADEYLGALMPAFYEGIARISSATGNVVDAKDRPLFDALYEMIEKVEMDFDEEGEHNTTLVVHPDTAPLIQEALENLTREQQQRLDELMQRKREESDARRRRRRLS